METVGAGAVEPIWETLKELRVPTLLLAGERDSKYVDMMTRMDGILPKSTLEIVEKTGHCIHVEAPSRLASILLRSDPPSSAEM
jgi:2-succinyl-6-hydroxy-2,4-cyclohexadiene-1-carboxylate synthase